MDMVRITRVISLLTVASGVAAIAMPKALADFVGLAFETGSASGYGEIGAVYGGNFIALGAIGLYAARATVAAGSALLTAVGVVWLSIASGRLAVILLTAVGPVGVMSWVWLAMETAAGLCFVVAARGGGAAS